MIFSLLIAVAMAAVTWTVGWWGVAVVALIVGVVYRDQQGRAWRVALGASEGWIALLVIDVIAGPFGRVATTLGGAMSLPVPALLLVTLLFPAVMGWSAAALGAELGQLRPRASRPA
jgi:hypothetical protein